MEKQKKILDASVLMKWFVKEEHSEKVISLLEKHAKWEFILIVPELIFLEVLNGLRYKRLEKSFLSDVNKTLWNAQFLVQKITPNLCEKILEISVQENLTIYDSVYVALAQLNNCELITADEELYRIPNVVPLEKVAI